MASTCPPSVERRWNTFQRPVSFCSTNQLRKSPSPVASTTGAVVGARPRQRRARTMSGHHRWRCVPRPLRTAGHDRPVVDVDEVVVVVGRERAMPRVEVGVATLGDARRTELHAVHHDVRPRATTIPRDEEMLPDGTPGGAAGTGVAEARVRQDRGAVVEHHAVVGEEVPRLVDELRLCPRLAEIMRLRDPRVAARGPFHDT